LWPWEILGLVSLAALTTSRYYCLGLSLVVGKAVKFFGGPNGYLSVSARNSNLYLDFGWALIRTSDDDNVDFGSWGAWLTHV